MIIINMSNDLRPIITSNKIVLDNVTITKATKYTKTKRNFIYTFHKHITCYNFSHDITHPINVMSCFLDLVQVPSTERYTKQITFTIDLNTISSNEFAFNQTIRDIVTKIITHLLAEHPTLKLKNIKSPIVDIAGKSQLCLRLYTSKGQLKCPTYIHQSKAKGGATHTIMTPDSATFLTQLHEQAPLLRFPSYQNRILDPTIKNDPTLPIVQRIFYKAKFMFKPCVSVCYTQDEITNEIIRTSATIVLSVSELELKYNTSNAKSVLGQSVCTIKPPIEAPTSIAI